MAGPPVRNLSPAWPANLPAVARGDVADLELLRAAIRVGAVAAPDERRRVFRATRPPRGRAMLAGFLVAMLVAWRSGRFDAVFREPAKPNRSAS